MQLKHLVVHIKTKKLGTFGDVGGFSFYGNKLITTGEGGAIVTNSKKLQTKLLNLKIMVG